MVETVSREVEGVIEVLPMFVPAAPVQNIPTKLNDEDQRNFMLAVNMTRMGVQAFDVAVTYDIQMDGDTRTPPTDFVAVEGVSNKLHIGAMTTATFSKKGDFYIRLADILRASGLNIGWTTMRASGIRSFKILTMKPGPIFVRE